METWSCTRYWQKSFFENVLPTEGGEHIFIKNAKRCSAIITAENHSIIGGLGSAVAEALVEAGLSKPFKRIGVQDVFAEGGSTDYLFNKYGLNSKNIANSVIELLH